MILHLEAFISSSKANETPTIPCIPLFVLIQEIPRDTFFESLTRKQRKQQDMRYLFEQDKEAYCWGQRNKVPA